MTNLRVKQIKTKLLGLFQAHLDLSDLKEKDKDRETKILTRCLAAFAVYNLSGCSEAEAAHAVWDGPDDNGIDAAYHDISESRVILVQSKWIHAGAGEPEAKEISVFADGVRDLIEQETANFHTRLKVKLTDMGQAVMAPGNTVHLVLISTGASTISKHGTNSLDRVLSELNGLEAEEPIATRQVIGLSEVYSALGKDAAHEIIIDTVLVDWSQVGEPYVAYFGTIDGLQLKQWWSSYGKRLLDKNIRHALGATEVNNQIRQTALSEPGNFWYFNNGITLIAEEATRAPIAAASRAYGNFQLRGASIVNGAQTVSTLGRIENDDVLGLVKVPIRVILLKNAPPNFGGNVTRTNNLQNRVEARDFVAQDPEQSRLQMEMTMEGVEYQFLRTEDFVASPTSCDLVEVTTALACASGDITHAVAVKTGIGRFFQDLKKAPYKAIFNPNLSGARAFNTTLIQRSIDEWIDAKKKACPKKSGFSWGVLIHGNRVLAAGVFKMMGGDSLAAPIIDFRSSFSRDFVHTHCETIYTRMVDRLEKNYHGKFLAVVFKSPSNSRDIFENATSVKKP